MTKCGSPGLSIYELLPGREILYIISIASILGNGQLYVLDSLGPFPIDTLAPIVLTRALLVLILLPAVEMEAKCI